MNKYGNRKTYVDGIKFDSKREAERYIELKLLERAGVISNLVLQPKYVLQDKFRRNGKTVRAIHYIADFEYIEDGIKVVEDVKGMETKDFKLKEKMFLFRYPEIEFRKTK